jgi:hypothetical protein
MLEQVFAEDPELDELYDTAQGHEPELDWRYVVKGLFRRGETSILYAPSNVGKSALVVLLGSTVAAGRPFAGRPTSLGLVVHVAAEAPTSILDRTAAFRLELAAPGSAPYVVRRRGLDLREPPQVAALVSQVRTMSRSCGHPVSLVVFDTLVLCIGTADENSPSDMSRAIEGAKRIATELDAHVMLVHHTGKDAERGARGTSALQAGIDTEVALIPGDGGVVRVVVTKQRDMAKAGGLAFRVRSFHLGEDEDGDPRTTARAELVDVPADASPAPKSLGDRRAAVLTALHLRRLTQAGNAEPRPFSTRDVVESLPEEVLTGVAPENRPRVVGKILVEISKEPGAVLSKSGEGWVLAKAPAPGSTNPV